MQIDVWRRAWPLLVLLGSLTGCFSMIRDPQRHFYVLHVNLPGQPTAPPLGEVRDELARVRDLDCESAYDKFQIVVRKSPYELAYRQKDVWAVKPGRMISDLLARSLGQRGIFAGVTRELGERRPDWLVSGDLHVIEVEQTGPVWQAHVTITLQISAVDTGDIVWSAHYDEHEPCRTQDYAEAAEAMSRAAGRSIEKMLVALAANPPKLPANTPAPGQIVHGR